MRRLLERWTVCLAACLPASAWSGDATRERLLELLARDPQVAADPLVVRELVALGSGAVAPAIELLAGRAPELEADPARVARIELRKDLLWQALEAWPVEAVTQSAEQLTRGDVEEVLLGVRILARCGPPQAARTLLAAVCALDPTERARTRVQLELERGLGAIVARDAASTWQLADSINDVPPELCAAVARGVGQTLRPGGVLLLERLLGRSAELDRIVLAELAQVDPRDRQAVRHALAARLGKYLDHRDARLRGQAARSLGLLHDFASTERLIAVLDAGGSTGQAALEALQQIAGLRWPGEARRWKNWHQAQAAWLEESLPLLEQEVQDEDPGRAAAALRELGQHGHLRDEIAPSLLAALGRRDADVVRLACSVAAATRCDAALSALVERLDHADESVRQAALAALRSLSGQAGSMESAWWRAWLRD